MTGVAPELGDLVGLLARVAGRRLVLEHVGSRVGYREGLANGVHAELGGGRVATREGVGEVLEPLLSGVLGPVPESVYARRYESVTAHERTRVRDVATLVASGVPLEWALRRTLVD